MYLNMEDQACSSHQKSICTLENDVAARPNNSPSLDLLEKDFSNFITRFLVERMIPPQSQNNFINQLRGIYV